ncbi:MAG: MFS transporter, partial [Alphaproteobacteria bacterium]
IFNGPGASASVSGFRMGMWVSGGGALYLSAFFSWGVVYALMAMCVMVGIFATLVLPEPDHCNDCATTPDGTKLMQTFRQEMANGLYPAIVSFFKKPDWLIVLTFVFLYKIGDTVLNMISIPFLLEIGFSKIEIANVAKTFGIAAMMVGGIIGGISIMRFGIVRNLMVSTAMLVISCLLFMLQARMGSNLELLVFTMGFENLACGISAATLIAYFSSMCNPPNTATMFAILSSFSSMARVSLSVIAGWTADHVSWETFFGLVAIGCTCALVFIWTHATELTGEKFIQRKQGHFPSAR